MVDRDFLFGQGEHGPEDLAVRLEVEVLGRQDFGRCEDRLLVEKDRPEHGPFGFDAVGQGSFKGDVARHDFPLSVLLRQRPYHVAKQAVHRLIICLSNFL